MENLATIIAFSGIVWYLIDRFKGMWQEHPHAALITTVVAGVLGALCTFAYGLDIVYSLNLSAAVTPVGQGLTVIAFMAGSSVVNEIIMGVKGE